MPYQEEIKAIKLLQDKAKKIDESHKQISSDIDELKALLKNHTASLDENDFLEIEESKKKFITEMSTDKALEKIDISIVYAEANATYDKVSLDDILSVEDFKVAESKYNQHVIKFNKRYSLDAWDYAIATSCGLFAAMLDIFFVSAPSKPTTSFDAKVNGTFNRWVQDAFNKAIPPDLSKTLSLGNTIGSADASTSNAFYEKVKGFTPYNHRLKALSHDPILGFIFGIVDMMNGTCTVVNEGKIQVLETIRGPMPDESMMRRIGRMFGHLLSDVNAPSASGNRGMGLPAPFMGLLRMFDNIPFGDSTFGKQIEYMYVNGYDFRQFIATSIPMMIMEVMLRVFYTVKQMKLYDAPFGESILDTMPLNLNPKFRIMLALAYGTSSAVNAGKVYVTQNILNANYASWMGFAWNSFHALKWALWDRQNKLWDEILDSEVAEIEKLVTKMEEIEARARTLPV